LLVLGRHAVARVDRQAQLGRRRPHLPRRKIVRIEGDDLDRVEPHRLELLQQRQILVDERLGEQQ